MTTGRVWVEVFAQIEMFGGGVTNADERLLLAFWHSDHIEPRLPTSDQQLFTEQRAKIAGVFFPNDRLSSLDDSARFFVRVVGHEIAEQAISKRFRLPNVD